MDGWMNRMDRWMGGWMGGWSNVMDKWMDRTLKGCHDIISSERVEITMLYD